MAAKTGLTIRGGLLALAGFCLSACATGDAGMPAPPNPFTGRTDPTPVQGDAAQLSAQDLSLGACGAFFWGVTEPNAFLAFENETTGLARIFAYGSEHGFYTQPQSRQPVSGDQYRRRYVDRERGLDFEISGVFGDRMRDGVRIERAVLRNTQPSGAVVVTPVAGLHACRSLG